MTSTSFIVAMTMISLIAKADVIQDNGSQPPSVYYPGHDCCILYDDTNLRSTKKKFCHTGKATVFEMKDDFIDNKVSSYYCGKNVWYNFCKNQGGHCNG